MFSKKEQNVLGKCFLKHFLEGEKVMGENEANSKVNSYLFGQIKLGSRSIQREPKGLLRLPLVRENYTMPIFLYIMCVFYFI